MKPLLFIIAIVSMLYSIVFAGSNAVKLGSFPISRDATSWPLHKGRIIPYTTHKDSADTQVLVIIGPDADSANRLNYELINMTSIGQGNRDYEQLSDLPILTNISDFDAELYSPADGPSVLLLASAVDTNSDGKRDSIHIITSPSESPTHLVLTSPPYKLEGGMQVVGLACYQVNGAPFLAAVVTDGNGANPSIHLFEVIIDDTKKIAIKDTYTLEAGQGNQGQLQVVVSPIVVDNNSVPGVFLAYGTGNSAEVIIVHDGSILGRQSFNFDHAADYVGFAQGSLLGDGVEDMAFTLMAQSKDDTSKISYVTFAANQNYEMSQVANGSTDVNGHLLDATSLVLQDADDRFRVRVSFVTMNQTNSEVFSYQSNGIRKTGEVTVDTENFTIQIGDKEPVAYDQKAEAFKSLWIPYSVVSGTAPIPSETIGGDASSSSVFFVNTTSGTNSRVNFQSSSTTSSSGEGLSSPFGDSSEELEFLPAILSQVFRAIYNNLGSIDEQTTSFHSLSTSVSESYEFTNATELNKDPNGNVGFLIVAKPKYLLSTFNYFTPNDQSVVSNQAGFVTMNLLPGDKNDLTPKVATFNLTNPNAEGEISQGMFEGNTNRGWPNSGDISKWNISDKSGVLYSISQKNKELVRLDTMDMARDSAAQSVVASEEAFSRQETFSRTVKTSSSGLIGLIYDQPDRETTSGTTVNFSVSVQNTLGISVDAGLTSSSTTKAYNVTPRVYIAQDDSPWVPQKLFPNSNPFLITYNVTAIDPSPSTTETALGTATRIGVEPTTPNGVYYTSDFSWIYYDAYPWVYLYEDDNWIYLLDESEVENLWFWEGSWYWTMAQYFPWCYNVDQGHWIVYDQ